MTDKQIKEDIKQVVTNLGNIKFTVEDELEFCKEVLKLKEQECEKIKNWVKGMMFYTDCSNWFERFTTAFEDWKNDLTSQLDQLKAENDELKRLIAKQKNAKIQLSKLKDKQYKEFCDMKQNLVEIKDIAEPYKMTIKKICGNCKKYDDCYACCYKDINYYKYTSSKTNACEEFTYLDEFVPNILANKILQKISKMENDR